ncbi:MAG: D-alanyl-D-alanine carboxypeptidase [Thermodesulfobacteriota bacterium]
MAGWDRLQAAQDIKAGNNLQRQLKKLVSKGAYAVTRNGKIIAYHNLDQKLVPASISKFFTVLAALDRLGPDHRFRTEFFTDEQDNLYIKGYGDPFLISERIEEIMQTLKKSGVATINNILIDDSSYRLQTPADGAGSSLNPYDVSGGALVVNFNTINIVVGKDGKVRSGEPQTPLLPIMTEISKSFRPGEYRVNISNKPGNVLQLTGQLFRAFQKKAGIKGEGIIKRRRVPDGEPILRYFSTRKLTDMTEGLMLYSNNFIANQIFLETGATAFGYPATWLKGRRALKEFTRQDEKLAKSFVSLVEGSGLSRKNILTAKAMLRALKLFKPHASLLPKKDGALIKSGTLSGVYSYAGYLPGKNSLDSFVIILNQQQNNRDEVLQILKQIHAKQP